MLIYVLRVCDHEFFGFRPECGQALRRIVEVDGEAVGLVVVFHVFEDVVVDVAEEVHLRLHTPVPSCVGERWVLVEEAAVPAAHLVVGGHVCVLDFLLFEDFGGFVE